MTEQGISDNRANKFQTMSLLMNKIFSYTFISTLESFGRNLGKLPSKAPCVAK